MERMGASRIRREWHGAAADGVQHRLRTWLILAGIGLIAGCATQPSGVAREFVASDAGLTRHLEVAVLPLENLTSHPNAAEIIGQLVTTELYRQGLFQPMEETELRHRLASEAAPSRPSALAPSAAEVGKSLAVDAVLVGSVSEYGYQYGLQEQPTVGINLRLIRSGDGKVLWAASRSETGRGYFHREGVNEAALRVVTKMVNGLAASVSDSKPRARAP